MKRYTPEEAITFQKQFTDSQNIRWVLANDQNGKDVFEIEQSYELERVKNLVDKYEEALISIADYAEFGGQIHTQDSVDLIKIAVESLKEAQNKGDGL